MLLCQPNRHLFHDQQAYHPTCVLAHIAYRTKCAPASQILLCFPSKASFMIDKFAKSNVSLPTQHTQPLVSMLPESRFIHDHQAYQTTFFFSHPAYQNTRVPAPLPNAPMLPQQSIIHDRQAYQTTCFFASPAYPLAAMLPESRFVHDQQAYQTTCLFFPSSILKQMCLCPPARGSYVSPAKHHSRSTSLV